MKPTTLPLVVAVAAACLSQGCRRQAAGEAAAGTDDLIARVGDEVITVAEFETAMRRRGVGDDPAGRQALLGELIEHHKLVHKAKALGLDRDPEVVQQFESALIAKLREQRPLPADEEAPAVTEAELQAYYNGHRDEFRIPARIRAATVFVAAPAGLRPEKRAEKRARIEAARAAALAAQAPPEAHFGGLAVQFSEDQATRYLGGDLGYLIEGETTADWDPALAKALFDLESVGALSDVVETADGFHVFKLMERIPETFRPFGSVQGAIRSRLAARKQDTDREAWIAAATDGIPVEVAEARLPRRVAPPDHSPTTPPPTPGH